MLKNNVQGNLKDVNLIYLKVKVSWHHKHSQVLDAMKYHNSSKTFLSKMAMTERFSFQAGLLTVGFGLMYRNKEEETLTKVCDSAKTNG